MKTFKSYLLIPDDIKSIQANPPRPMQAFHGSKAIKDFYLGRVRQHAKADQIIKGTYWQDGKGCAVGCSIHSGNHGAYETELGIPRTLARLEDVIFERTENGVSKKWPERFMSAPKVGADLYLVWPKFAVWLLVDKKDGVIRFAKTEKSKNAIKATAGLWQRVIAGESVASLRPEFERARAAAAAAAYAAADAAYAAAVGVGVGAAAAYAAAYAAADAADAADAAADAAYAAYAAGVGVGAAAAYAAAAAAADAAYAAYAAAVGVGAAAADAAAYADAAAAYAAYVGAAAARNKFWKSAADKMIELMQSAPIAKRIKAVA